MKIGSLFSGYGGLDMAVEAVFPNARPAWFCEWDEAPSRILAHHWPDVPNYRDVTAVDWSAVEPVDIITGGSPCQDLSSAGKRAGMTEGTRSNLWVNMREAIIQLKPRLVVWENVLGALSAEAFSDSDVEPGDGLLGVAPTGNLRALGRVLGDLAEAGYDAQWEVVRAADVGAPHARARVFLLARPSGTTIGGYAGSHAGDRNGREAVAYSDSDRRRGGNGPGYSGSRRTPGGPEGRDSRAGQGEGEDIRGRSTVRSVDEGTNWGDYEPAVRRWEALTRPAPPPTAPNRNDRPRLTPAFAEWMMGLPEGHVTGVDIPRVAQLRAIGNGVCPPQAAAALRSLLELEAVTA